MNEYIDEEYNDEEEEYSFEFGEPMHPENLPDCPLKIGDVYLVPMRLTLKDRKFDGGRGTEWYEFQYVNRDPKYYAPIRIVDYHMSKSIRKFSEEK